MAKDKAIDNAKILAKKANVNATFICCDIYDLPAYLNGQFDIVFTSNSYKIRKMGKNLL